MLQSVNQLNLTLRISLETLTNEYEKVRVLCRFICKLMIISHNIQSKIGYKRYRRTSFEILHERMHISDSIKDDNEDTIMHEYVYDTFKEMFRDSDRKSVV